MVDLDVVAYAAMGLSLSVTAMHIGQWLLNANPRTVINAARWVVAGGIGLTPLVLVWLAMSGRSTLALMLMAFVLPLLVRGVLRWRAPLGSLTFPGHGFPRWGQDFNAPIPSSRVTPDPIDPALVRQSAAVLRAYVEQATGDSGGNLTRMPLADKRLNGSSNGAGRRGMSVQEALNILGLEPTARPPQISEAHHWLKQKLSPEIGETHYLVMKIDEAKDVLLLEG